MNVSNVYEKHNLNIVEITIHPKSKKDNTVQSGKLLATIACHTATNSPRRDFKKSAPQEGLDAYSEVRRSAHGASVAISAMPL